MKVLGYDIVYYYVCTASAKTTVEHRILSENRQLTFFESKCISCIIPAKTQIKALRFINKSYYDHERYLFKGIS